MIERIWKPWLVYRPKIFLHRLRQLFSPIKPGYQELATSWGVRIKADPHQAIGRSILTTGPYDLAVSETIARLVDPGDHVIDAGTNIAT